MNIRMYNCSFGDCFRLSEEHKNSLYVDFGIHWQSRGKSYRTNMYNKILQDMPDNVDFLLTHYHEDHYEGVVYMINQCKYKFKHKYIYKRFENVYIPDIWNINDSVDIVRLILLRGLLTKYVIQNGLTIFDFLIAICNMNSRVHFIGKGDVIQDNYNVLWPERDQIKPLDNNLVYPEIPRGNMSGDFIETLNDITNKLVKLMRSITNNEEDGRNNRVYIDELTDLSERYNTLADLIDNRNLQSKLSSWQNDISIVFHSKKEATRKVLFTGDVPKKYWKIIRNNICIDYKNKDIIYEVIKVPHHGTASYYYDFKSLSSNITTFLIPNGDHYFWKIDSRYSHDINTISGRAICSNNNCCKARLGCFNKHNFSYCNRCCCVKNIIIANSNTFYADI